MSSDIERLRRELADHDARERARAHEKPEWYLALDDLCVGNYDNPDFWPGFRDRIREILSNFEGTYGDEDEDFLLRRARAWFAGKCRICRRAMHVTDVQAGRCRNCGADNQRPEVVSSTIVEDRVRAAKARLAAIEAAVYGDGATS